MNERQVKTLFDLGRQLPEPAELLDLLALTGNALARHVAVLRARQAALETARVEARTSTPSAEHRSRQEAAERGVAGIDAEIDRLRLVRPPSGDDHTSAVGYVRDAGEPVSGAEVRLMLGERVMASCTTGEDGSFAVSAQAREPLGLSVVVGRTLVHRDQSASLLPAPIASYRVVDVASTKPRPPCDGSEQPPKGRGSGVEGGKAGVTPDQPRTWPDLRGATLNQGLQELARAGVGVARVHVVAAAHGTPRVLEVVDEPTTAGVTLEVGASDSDAARLLVLASLLGNDDDAGSASVAGVMAARSMLRAAGVTSLEGARELAELPAKGFAERCGVASRSEASSLKHALTRALGKIDVAAG